jgi:hypothetical protein
MLTKDDVHAIRHADDICIHLSAKQPEGLVRLIKRKPYGAKPFETDQEHVLPAKVRFETSLGKDALDKGTAECFAMSGIYHNQNGTVSNILRTLRIGDELHFSFWPDAHSNDYVARAGLHADVVFLRVYRGGKRIANWEFEQSICPDNTARMCRGVPFGKSYLDAMSRAG